MVTREFPTAAELDLGDYEVPEGLCLVVFPPAQEHVWDPIWYDQGGRDPIDRKKIFKLPAGPEQTIALEAVLQQYPKYGPKMYEKAAGAGKADVIRVLVQLRAKLENDREAPDGSGDERLDRSDDQDGEEVEEESEDDEDFPTPDVDSPLHLAAFKGHLDCVRALVEDGKLSVDAQQDNFSVLANAVVGGHADLARWLLDRGATIAFERESGMNDVEDALRSGNVEVALLILDSPQAAQHGFILKTENLEIAAYSGNAEMIKLVLERTGLASSDPKTLTPESRQVIIESVSRATSKASLESVELLLPYLSSCTLDGLFEYTEVDEISRHTLFNATEDALVEADCPQLFQLIWQTFLRPAEAVLSADAAAKELYDEWLGLRLLRTCQEGRPETTKLLCEEYDANVNRVSNKYFSTPLARAAASGANSLSGRLQVVRYLLNTDGIDIHLANGAYANGSTALALTVHEGQSQAKMVRVLLDYGGPVEELDSDWIKSVDATDGTTEVYVVLRCDKPRQPVTLLSKDVYDALVTHDEMETISLTASAADLRGWAAHLQTRKSDQELLVDDPKKRLLAT
ncbi:hypothetical protein LTR08_004757 [Meristemomyces frigidus]|nr:hypothetical protein LTR08_004757 [Meristemomyces frigidus]